MSPNKNKNKKFEIMGKSANWSFSAQTRAFPFFKHKKSSHNFGNALLHPFKTAAPPQKIAPPPPSTCAVPLPKKILGMPMPIFPSKPNP